VYRCFNDLDFIFTSPLFLATVYGPSKALARLTPFQFCLVGVRHD
jgi:hypothetical protein